MADEYFVAARIFDVCSINVYEYEPTRQIIHAGRLTDRPILIGEYHIGVPADGLAAGLVQAASQLERGVAYRYYVEQAASLEWFLGAYWFAWKDEPVLGRMDGENYNIGFVDVTDRPYAELVEAAKVDAQAAAGRALRQAAAVCAAPHGVGRGRALDAVAAGRIGLDSLAVIRVVGRDFRFIRKNFRFVWRDDDAKRNVPFCCCVGVQPCDHFPAVCRRSAGEVRMLRPSLPRRQVCRDRERRRAGEGPSRG